MEKFRLESGQPKYRQTDSQPKIRVRRDTYAILTAWAVLAGCSLPEVVDRVVTFAADNLEEGEQCPD